MKKIIIILLLLLSTKFVVFAQTYPISSIKKELLRNADLVIRQQTEYLQVFNPQKVVHHSKSIISVFNKKGKDEIDLMIAHNSARKIERILIKIYDKEGKLLLKLNKKDLSDISLSYENTLIDDTRYLTFSYAPIAYPFTVDYEIDVIESQSLFLPKFYLKPYRYCSIEKQEFTIIANKETELITKLVDAPKLITRIEKKDAVHYYYVDSNLYVEDANDGKLLCKLNEFNLYGNIGSLRSWEDLGNFYFDLNKERLKLPENYVNELKEQTKNVSDTAEKVKLLYKKLQDNFRYVSIQLGIGGWKCIDASTTLKYGFGDCKALTNLMCAMLNEIGIKSYASLIYAKRNFEPVLADFPLSSFNHVILCVPLSKDTLWLECTDNISNFNYLNSYTTNKYTLLVKPSKSELIKTPNFSKDSIISSQVYSIESTGLSFSINVDYVADCTENIIPIVINNHQKEKEEFILKNYNLRNISDYTFLKINSALPKVRLNLKAANIIPLNKSGKRIYLKLNKNEFSSYRFELPTINYYASSIVLIDTIRIIMPENYVLESRINDYAAVNEFGSLNLSSKVFNDEIYIYRKLSVNQHKFTRENVSNFELIMRNFNALKIEELVFMQKNKD